MVSMNTLWISAWRVAGCGSCGNDRAPGDPTDPAQFTSPAGEELAFGVKEGNIRNYFHRQGPSAVHLLTRSGSDPRLVGSPLGLLATPGTRW